MCHNAHHLFYIDNTLNEFKIRCSISIALINKMGQEYNILIP